MPTVPRSTSIGSTTSARPGTTMDPIEAARQEAFGLLRGQVASAGSNPTDAFLLQALRGRATGAGPYDEATKNALFTQAAEGAAAAETAQQRRISGSAGDPSNQAQMNEAAARRQAAVQRAGLDIASQANIANYDAQGRNLGQLAQVNLSQRQSQGNAINDLVGLLSREERTTQMPGIPSYSQYSGGGSGDTLAAQQARNAAWSAQHAAPARGVAPGTMVRGTPQTYQPQAQPAPQGNVRIIGGNASYTPYAQTQQPQRPVYGPQRNIPPASTSLNPFA